LSLLVVALCAGAGGCAAKVDLAKVTYTRTTVPAAAPNTGGGGSTASTGTPKTNDPAFASEKLRVIDACKLFDNDLLSSVGTPADNNTDDFSRCSNFMKDTTGKELNLTLTLGEGLIEDPSKADKNIGGLPGIVSELDDKTACFVTAVTETSPNRGVKVQVGGKAGNMCDLGAKVLEGVLGKIRNNPPKYDIKPGSLVEVDPCTLPSDSDVSGVMGAAKSEPTSLHWCSWTGGSATLWVWLRSGVDPAKIADPAKTSKVDVGGISATQELDTNSTKCEVAWSHLPIKGNIAEVVSVSYLTSSAKQGEDLCAKAATIAKALVPKLPKG
jgi:hypothetical protein